MEVQLGVLGGQGDAALGDVRITLRAKAGRVGVDELAVVGDAHREPFVHVAVTGGRVGHPEAFVSFADHVDAAAGDAARQIPFAVAAREIHDDGALGVQHLDAVPGGLGLDLRCS